MYLYELRLFDLEGMNYVQMERDSVNFTTFLQHEKKINSTAFVCEAFNAKGGKLVGRASTRLPKRNMIELLTCLIFAPYVTRYPSEGLHFYQ